MIDDDYNIRFPRCDMVDLNMDPPIGSIINPVRRIKVTRDKRVRFIVVFDGTGVSATGKNHKAALVIRPCVAQVDICWFGPRAIELSL